MIQDMGTFDIAVLAVIGAEVAAVRSACGIDNLRDRFSSDGDLYWKGMVSSQLATRPLSVVVHGQAVAGEQQSSAAVTKVIERFQPRIIIQIGIAAGRRHKCLIGNVCIPHAVLDVTKEVAVPGTTQRRPTIIPLPHAMQQMLLGFEMDTAEWQRRFTAIHGRPLTPSPGEEDDFTQYVACPPSQTFDGVLASDNTLLRDPAVLEHLAATIHPQVCSGEMEAAGLVTACAARSPEVPWLILRGISDFGDTVKHDGFHRLASCAAASYLAYFLAEGLDLDLLPPGLPEGGTGIAIPAEDTSRAPVLDTLRRESLGRCMERWQAAGITREQAKLFAEDTTLGAPGATISFTADNPLMVVTAEVGSGKSLMAERVFQHGLDMIAEQPDAPIPVFLRSSEAANCVGRLADTLCDKARRLGNPQVQGILAVIDGLDEIEVESSHDLLQEARILVNTHPASRVMMTSRSLPFLEGIPELKSMPLLSIPAVEYLMQRVMGVTSSFSLTAHLSPSLKTAVQRPLFAILSALYQRENTGYIPRSQADMLTWIIERSLVMKKIDLNAASSLLRKLAVRQHQHGGEMIPQADISYRWEEILPLLYSRLITRDGSRIAFSLQVYAEWFAAQAILCHEVTLKEILVDVNRVYDWRYPLALAISMANYSQAARLLHPLIERYPGVAALIVSEALVSASLDDQTPAPPNDDCGRQLREAMQTWMDGIGPVTEFIAPVRPDGTLCPLGVNTPSPRGIEYTWYYGDTPLQEIVPLSEVPNDAIRSTLRYSAVSFTQQGWAWRLALDELSKEMSERLEKCAFPVNSLNSPLVQEYMWLAARAVLDKDYVPIAVNEVAAEIHQIRSLFHENERIVVPGFGMDFPISVIEEDIAHLTADGVSHLTPPWPLPTWDESENTLQVWNGYTIPATSMTTTNLIIHQA